MAKFPVYFPVTGKLVLETGSTLTASAAKWPFAAVRSRSPMLAKSARNNSDVLELLLSALREIIAGAAVRIVGRPMGDRRVRPPFIRDAAHVLPAHAGGGAISSGSKKNGKTHPGHRFRSSARDACLERFVCFSGLARRHRAFRMQTCRSKRPVQPMLRCKKSKIFCFEIDGRLVAKVFEVGGEPFIGPRSTHLMKVA